jgi:hypothetical protein
MRGTISFRWSTVLERYDAGMTGAIGVIELGSWLSNDIQTSRNSVDFWLKRIGAVASGEINGGYLGTGNAHTVMAGVNGVYIQCEYVEERKIFLSCVESLSVLSKYRAFLESDFCNRDDVPEPIEFEYEAEGEEALERYAQTGGLFEVSDDDVA